MEVKLRSDPRRLSRNSDSKMNEKKELAAVKAAVNNLLPLELRVRLDVDVLAQAVCLGYITIADDHLQWQWESHTLLAYFIGRMLGDTCNTSKRKTRYWVRSPRRAPEALLTRLFHIPNLGQIRRNRAGLALPEDFLVINQLFDN